MHKIKIGSKVKILRKDIFHLQHRENRNGTVTRINGAYVTIRPTWVVWEIELLINEIAFRK
jgi:hypothetical protein